LPSNPAIRAALARLMKDPNQRLQGQAIALYQGQDGGVSVDQATGVGQTLDFEFFARRVMPILAAKGRDGNACVNCHSNHNILRLNPPDGDGRFTSEQLRENYRSALKVVDLANPENSLLLRKPTSNSEQEGVVGAQKLSHGGGPRWTGPDDPGYKTVLEWINGARISSSVK
jgi:hypothetical protein